MSKYKYIYFIQSLNKLILWPNNHLENLNVMHTKTHEFFDAEYIGEL